VELD
jgi:hypothetical protein